MKIKRGHSAPHLGLEHRAEYFPYGLVEGEPTFPLTNCAPSGVADGLARYPWDRPYLGCMANAQTHVVQLPNTYLFAHFARGGSPEAATGAAVMRFPVFLRR